MSAQKLPTRRNVHGELVKCESAGEIFEIYKKGWKGGKGDACASITIHGLQFTLIGWRGAERET